jgi:outer membrane protein TolC
MEPVMITPHAILVPLLLTAPPSPPPPEPGSGAGAGAGPTRDRAAPPARDPRAAPPARDHRAAPAAGALRMRARSAPRHRRAGGHRPTTRRARHRSRRAAPRGADVQRIAFERLLSQALKKNRDLERAGLDLAKARQDVRTARGEYDTTLGAGISYRRSTSTPVEELNIQTLRSSGLEYNLGASQKLPTGGTVSLELTTSRSTSLTRFSFSGDPFENETETWDSALTLKVSHPLLKGMGLDTNLAALRQARLARGAAAWAARAKAEAVVRDLYKAYLDVVAAEAGVQVRRQAVEQAARDLARSEALVEAGRMAEADLVDYRFAVAQQRRGLLEARTTWLQASLALRMLTGQRIRPSQGLIGTTQPENPFGGEAPTAREAARAALRHSRDLLAALEQLKIKEIELTARQRDTWPSLDVSAAVGPQGRASSFGAAHETLFKFDSLSWSVGLTFSYLIGNHAARAARAKARLQVRRQKVAIDELKQGLISEATRTAAQLQLDRRLAHTAAEEHRLAKLRLENERKRYAAGRSSLYVVLQLQNEAVATAHKALSARLAVLKRRADLETLTGTLLARFGLRAKDLEPLRLSR